ncbi:MAG: hypothetical protein ACRCXZ_07195 [Patescibacteria group bacterium]
MNGSITTSGSYDFQVIANGLESYIQSLPIDMQDGAISALQNILESSRPRSVSNSQQLLERSNQIKQKFLSWLNQKTVTTQGKKGRFNKCYPTIGFDLRSVVYSELLRSKRLTESWKEISLSEIDLVAIEQTMTTYLAGFFQDRNALAAFYESFHQSGVIESPYEIPALLFTIFTSDSEGVKGMISLIASQEVVTYLNSKVLTKLSSIRVNENDALRLSQKPQLGSLKEFAKR